MLTNAKLTVHWYKNYFRFVDAGRHPNVMRQPVQIVTSPLVLQQGQAQIPPPFDGAELRPTAPGLGSSEQEHLSGPNSPWQHISRRSLDEMLPRRNLREFSAYSRQYKRMRPCFYSPIQCLMRKRSSE